MAISPHGIPHDQLAGRIAQIVRDRHVIVASNRGPVEYHREPDGKLTTKRGSGGLVTALGALAGDIPLTWIAVAMSDTDREVFPDATAPARDVRLGRQHVRVRYVNTPPQNYAHYYDHISNQTLWFLQHHLWDPTRTPNFTEADYHAWYEGYHFVNHALAGAIADEALASAPGASKRSRDTAGANAIVLVQDYHLYLTPHYLRQRLPRASIQQFIHIPWPELTYWRLLPESFLTDIYTSLAACDVLGFQTERDAHNFLECARELLPGSRIDHDEGRMRWRNKRLLARAYPITIDADEVHRALRSAAAHQAAQQFAPLFDSDLRILVRVDRLEPAKNIIRGLLAYEDLLMWHPELHGKVCHLVFLVPSRESLDIYRTYGRDVRKLIHHINKVYGTPEWKPVHAYFDNNRARALVALRRADALLVNPIIDGMNLVAKEGAVANTHHGVIVLSRTAGAYLQMADAVLPVTATDLVETKDQLYRALTMATDTRANLARLAREDVERDTLADWMLHQLRDAAAVWPGQPRPTRASHATDGQPHTPHALIASAHTET